MITGFGVASSIGMGRRALGEGLRARRSGITERTLFNSPRIASRTAAQIADFTVEDYLERPKAYLDRVSELAFAGLSLALEDADIDPALVKDNPRVGLVTGSAYGNLQTMALFFADLLKKGPRFVKPFLFPHTYANTSISLLAMDYGLKGPHLHFASGSVASAHAIIAGFDLIRAGKSDMVLAGGFEALSEPLVAGCEAAGLLSPNDGGSERCAPFDRTRNGMVLGEGCGMLVLEEAEHAAKRGAEARAELVGVADGADSRFGAEDDAGCEGLVRAMTLAMKQAGWALSEVDWICACANGSAIQDRHEARAIARVFEGNACPAASSVQSMLGETLGAGSALRMGVALSAMELGYIPATVNLTDSAMASGVDRVINEGREQAVRNVLVNSADRGGSAVCLALTACGRQAF